MLLDLSSLPNIWSNRGNWVTIGKRVVGNK